MPPGAPLTALGNPSLRAGDALMSVGAARNREGKRVSTRKKGQHTHRGVSVSSSDSGVACASSAGAHASQNHRSAGPPAAPPFNTASSSAHCAQPRTPNGERQKPMSLHRAHWCIGATRGPVSSMARRVDGSARDLRDKNVLCVNVV